MIFHGSGTVAAAGTPVGWHREDGLSFPCAAALWRFPRFGAFPEDRAAAARLPTDPPCRRGFSADAPPDPISRRACSGPRDRAVSTIARSPVRLGRARAAPAGRCKSISYVSPNALKGELEALYALT